MFCGLSVSLLVTTVSLAKADKPIDVPFRVWTRVGPGNHVLDGARIRDDRGNGIPNGGGNPMGIS